MDDTTFVECGRTPGRLVVAVLFGLMLAWPAALALAGYRGADADFIYHHEERRPFVAPAVTSGALATGGWERDVERQVADEFPLRRPLIEGYAVAKYFWLGDVASPYVLRGTQGWLFYANEERQYEDGSYDPSSAQLARLADMYASRARWCAQHGMAYLFVLVPNKSEAEQAFRPRGVVRYVDDPAGARLVPLLRARGVRTVDLRDDLQRAATGGEVYSKGDTHWNDAGAYVAYRRIASELRSTGMRDNIAPRSIRSRLREEDGDLDRLAGIASIVRNEVVAYDFPARAQTQAEPSYPNDPLQEAFNRDAYAVNDARLPVAVVFGDSFTGALRRFLAEDFRRTVILQHDISAEIQFDRAPLDAERPQVVIDELVARALVFSDRFRP